MSGIYKNTTVAIFFFFFYGISVAFAQSTPNLYFLENDLKYERIPFTFSGNQIIIQLQLNGSKPLNFILDSGVKTPIIIDVPQFDTIEIRDYKKIEVKGLGQGDGIEALIAYDNRINVGDNIVNHNQTVIVLLEDIFHLSNKLGHNINGIIGFDLFRDFIVEINYDNQYLKLHDPKKFKYPRSKKYISKPLTFHRGKPFVNLEVELGYPSDNNTEKKIVPVKLLVDTGGSDALWLFINSHQGIEEPKKYINDFLGSGLSGDIFGKRSRISGLHIGDLILEDITVSYPDSSSVSYVMMHKERNGSIGGAALSKFKVLIDYGNKKITFRKGSNFRKGFYYNMSGMELKMPYPEFPVYEVSSVREGSPAEEAGVMVGDIVKHINYGSSASMTFPEIMSKFRTGDRKKIKLVLDRNGEKVKVTFRLRKTI
ncbi:MAG: hypothetical protein ABFR62_02825 [Bacteroidota bacterium]